MEIHTVTAIVQSATCVILSLTILRLLNDLSELSHEINCIKAYLVTDDRLRRADSTRIPGSEEAR